MLMFFDFLCYSIDDVFRKDEDSTPNFSAGVTISALQTSTICTGAMALGIIMHKEYFTKLFSLVVFGLLLIIN